MHSLKVITLFMKMKSLMKKRLFQDGVYRQSQETQTTGRSYCSPTLVPLPESESQHKSYPFSYYRLTVSCYYQAKETLVLGALSRDPSTSSPFGSGTMVPRSAIGGRQFSSSISHVFCDIFSCKFPCYDMPCFLLQNLTNISFSAVYRRVRQALNVVSRVSKGKSPSKNIRKFLNLL